MRTRPAAASERLARHPAYGSDLIVDVLTDLGIEHAALNPGATFRGLHDSIVNYGGNRSPELIQCCHEEIAVAMAHGYAKAAGRPMAAIVHDIVGLQHASMAIFNAWCDRTPVLVLGGTGPMAVEQRRPWIDWIHTALVQGQVVRDFVKWDDQPASLASIPESLLRAYRVAVTEPAGPVYMCFDVALQEMRVTEEVPIPPVQRYPAPSRLAADEGTLEEVARLLAGAEHPVILADYVGRNPDAVTALVELAEILAAPVIDLHGRFNFPNTHALDLTGAESDLLASADVILALDVMDLYGALSRTDRLTRRATPIASAAAKVIHIALADLAVRSWVADYQRLTPVDVPVLADTALVLPALVERLRKVLSDRGSGDRDARRARADRLRARHDALRASARAAAERAWGDVPVAPARLAAEVWNAVKNEDWVLTNGADLWPWWLWDWTRPDQYLGGSGGAGLGYGPAAALGAALAHRGSGRLCVALQPDGDLLYTPQALWTAAHHRIPILYIVCNNRTYGNDEVHQELIAKSRGRPVENRVIGIRLEDPPVDMAEMAKSFGVHAEGPVERPDAIGPALRRAIRVVREDRQPALVDVVIRTG